MESNEFDKELFDYARPFFPTTTEAPKYAELTPFELRQKAKAEEITAEEYINAMDYHESNKENNWDKFLRLLKARDNKKFPPKGKRGEREYTKSELYNEFVFEQLGIDEKNGTRSKVMAATIKHFDLNNVSFRASCKTYEEFYEKLAEKAGSIDKLKALVQDLIPIVKVKKAEEAPQA